MSFGEIKSKIRAEAFYCSGKLSGYGAEQKNIGLVHFFGGSYSFHHRRRQDFCQLWDSGCFEHC
jgi:hypothetical protein